LRAESSIRNEAKMISVTTDLDTSGKPEVFGHLWQDLESVREEKGKAE
jgi:hypothetical protein